MANPADVQYGGFWQRFFACFCDMMICAAISYAVTGALLNAGFDIMGAAVQFVSLAIFFGYFAVLQSSAMQATPGKMLLGLKVATTDGERASFLRNLLREVIGKFVSAATLMIGYLLAAFTDRKQALHDMIASTVVLKVAPAKVMLGAVTVVVSAVTAGWLFTTIMIDPLKQAMTQAMAEFNVATGAMQQPAPVPKVVTAKAVVPPAPKPAVVEIAKETPPAVVPVVASPKMEPKLASVAPVVVETRRADLPGPIQVRTIDLPGALEPAPAKAGPKYNDLMSAVMQRDAAGVNEQLALGRWVDKPDSKGITPLMAAAMLGDRTNAETLLKAGADAYPALAVARERRDAAMTSLLERYLTSKRP